MMRALILLCVVCGTAAADALTLSPAVVPLGGRPGQSTTQHLTLFNGTAHELAFEVVAKDVAVIGGSRVFVNAGELPGSIAATAVFSAASVRLRPGEERSIDVTLTLPPRVGHRGVIVLFQGTTRIGGNTVVSLGSLLTFDLAGKKSVAAGELHASPATASTNASFAIPVTNDGSEPMIARAAVAVVAANGVLVGKAALEPQRLLPGERAALRAEYPGELPAGTYRVIATVETVGRAVSRTVELVVR
ncbi:MAG TPA: hypothetical protein VM513_32015 [Kofleriaceae bacterium]|nr:hypothetical protein [Kofleriaceae bacterium]